MARRKRRTTKQKSRSSETPGYLWGVFGLAVGLSVAAAVYVNDRRNPPERTPEAAPASLASAVDNNGETVVENEPEAPPGDDGTQRFTFYEMLKRSEVLVPEEESARGSPEPVAVVEPGSYVLQVGSFSTHADADRRKAELALHGIESGIQKASVNNRIYYRVRIGPTDDLNELNMLRSRLRAAQIDAVRLRELD
ncbi:MAG: SPOR domain-containing protein [Pseudomonadota bacterium]